MSEKKRVASTAELLLGSAVPWPQGEIDYDVMEHVTAVNAKIVFEDDHVVAFEIDDDDREVKKAAGERRITIAPKKTISSLLDIGIADAQIAARLLFAVQQVAYKMSLHTAGFEVRLNVLPPYQRRPHLSLQIRSGNPKKPGLGS